MFLNDRQWTRGFLLVFYTGVGSDVGMGSPDRIGLDSWEDKLFRY